MKQMGFSKKWIDWIMFCVTTVNYSIFCNGFQVGHVMPRRGLHRGDPLSPYLFLFCIERLSHLIKNAAANGRVHDCQISENAPDGTHLLFTDDNFLFFRASEEEVI